MATVSGLTTNIARGVVKVSWTLTSSATVGRPAAMSRFPDKTLHVRGTFANGTVLLIGSNQSATIAQASLTTQALNDTRGEGNALTFTAANVVQILENPNLVYPKLSALGASAGGPKAIIVELIAQSTRR
jgi:hypothetical protein